MVISNVDVSFGFNFNANFNSNTGSSNINIARCIDLASALEKKSIYLFGPRQTGKSWLIRNTLQNHKVYNLLSLLAFCFWVRSRFYFSRSYGHRSQGEQKRVCT